MEERYSVSRLRANLYRVLDRVLATGEPVRVERHGHVLVIAPEESSDRLAGLRPHEDYLKVEPESLVHLDWSDEWRP